MPGRRSQIRFPVQATSKRRHLVTPGEQRRLREQIRFERPETRVLLMSAQLESSAENIPILRKPFRPAVLVERIGQLLRFVSFREACVTPASLSC
jgi:hypothetical protein